MRKLIESTLVSLDGVIESPEGWAIFDEEATQRSMQELDNYDAFLMGRVTYERFREGRRRQPLHRPDRRYAEIRRLPIAHRSHLELHSPRV
jgi:dihydrofolate reductase